MRMQHFWVRTAYLGALTLLVLMGLLTGSGMADAASLTELAKNGSMVFQFVAYGQVAFTCLLAPLFMAGAINEEYAGETFDVLLTTPLSNLQIVLGSFLGRLFFVLALLASGLPLFSVLLLFGGVAMESVFVAFAVAALAAVLVGAVAVALAVLRQGGRKAVYIFMISIAGYLVACYAADQVIRVARRPLVNVTAGAVQGNPQAGSEAGAAAAGDGSRQTAAAEPAAGEPLTLTPGSRWTVNFSSGQTTWLTPLHPLLVLEASINSSNYRLPAAEDLVQVHPLVRFYVTRPLATFASITGVLSLVLLLWSALRLRSYEGSSTRWLIWLRAKLGLPAAGLEQRRPARTVWHNPVAWREANTRARGVGAILSRYSFPLIALMLASVLLYTYHTGLLPALQGASGVPDRAWTFRVSLLTLLLIEVAVIVLVAVYMSAGSVSKEREDGTLDLMLTTPITPRQYLWGKLRGLVSFLGVLLAAPILTLAMVAAYSLIGNLMGATWAKADYVILTAGSAARMKHPLLLPEMALLLPLVLIPFVALCVTLGMNWSIRARGVLGAVVPTLGIVGVITAVTGFCGYSAAENIGVVGPAVNAFSPTTSLVMFLNPWETVQGFAESPESSRVFLAMAAVIAAAGYSLIVSANIQAMTRGFDHTVRKLTGENA